MRDDSSPDSPPDPLQLNAALSGEAIVTQYSKKFVWDFLRKFKGDIFTSYYIVAVDLSRLELIRRVDTLFRQCLISPETPCICNSDLGNVYFMTRNFLLSVQCGSLPQGLDKRGAVRQAVGFLMYGSDHAVLRLDRRLREEFDVVDEKMPVVSWELILDGRHISRNVGIDRADPVFPEYYPWIGEDIYGYFDRYLNSDESVLILLGETGTGKTSFIRSMIWHRLLNAKITYDEVLLASDELFFGFITDPQCNMLVIEDADLLLTSREHAGNRVMSRFLNMTDGLLSTKRSKKLVFTANILEANRVDSALLREGRCFDHHVFRRLSYPEACAAAARAGIPRPAMDRSYRLGELFKRKSNREKVRTLGFRQASL